MNKKEIANVIQEEKEKQNLTYQKIADKAGMADANVARFAKHGKDASYDTIISMLYAMGLTIVVEDKDVDWGLDMRLRRMPKKLYHGERIEAREVVEQQGFYGRVDLFESPEMVLKFIPKPCDVYEIRPGRLIRKYFDVVDHPYGLMYSFSENIPAEYIVNKVTYR